MAAANATRPIVPVNGGVRNVNVLMNLGVADYDGLQTQVSYRGNPKMYAAVSYTLSKATNTTEPDGNGIGPNDAQHRAPRRRGARPERASISGIARSSRSATSCRTTSPPAR